MAIGSALDQSGVHKHVTILDQGSEPESLAALAALVAGRSEATLLCADRNLGVAGGRNAAAAFGHGRVVVALDNDAEFASADTLAGMVAAIDENPSVGAIGCRILNYWSGEDDLTSWGYPKRLLSRASESFLATTFVGAGHAIRRTAWQEAGGYDDSLFFCWEEFDFCLRAIAYGWEILYRGDLAVRHKVAPEGRVVWSATRWFQFVRNRIYIGRKLGVGWCGLTPRIVGYLIKGLRNGLLRQTVEAIVAAAGMPTGGQRPASHVLRYLHDHDRVHRGPILTRIRTEVLTRL